MSPWTVGPHNVDVTADALADAVGVSRATIHAWVKRGLLPPVAFRGQSTRYGASHQLRARVIAKLRAEGVSLDEVGARLGASDAELAAAHGYAPATVVGAVAWERVALLPGLELHVAAGASELVRRIAAEIAARYQATAG